MGAIRMGLDSIDQLLTDQQEEILQFIESFVSVDSYTDDQVGVNRAGDTICQCLDKLNIAYERHANERYGDHIVGKIKGDKPGKILLLGHYDTVHRPGTTIVNPYREEGNFAYGPGVADMKSGVATMIYAAAALQKSDIELCTIELLFTPDEEKGSPISRPIIKKSAETSLAVFNLESGRPDGSVVTSRRGSAHFQFNISGKASHSGVAKGDGISAIEELAYKVVALKELGDREEGITINVGVVSGGVNTNVVAPHARGTIHVGYAKEERFREVTKQIESIMAANYISGTSSELSGGNGIPPMERHSGVLMLYDIVQAAATQLNIPIKEQAAKGAADSGFVASLGVPTICAMGPIGDDLHSVDEKMEKDSLIPRTKLLAHSIRLASEQLSIPNA